MMNPALKWTLIAGGTMTILGPGLGILGTVIGMMGSFHTLGASGVATPEKLSSDISITLISTGVGFVIGILGVITLLVALGMWLFDRDRQNPPTS